jgi:hypothetical protein
VKKQSLRGAGGKQTAASEEAIKFKQFSIIIALIPSLSLFRSLSLFLSFEILQSISPDTLISFFQGSVFASHCIHSYLALHSFEFEER